MHTLEDAEAIIRMNSLADGCERHIDLDSNPKRPYKIVPIYDPKYEFVSFDIVFPGDEICDTNDEPSNKKQLVKERRKER